LTGENELSKAHVSSAQIASELTDMEKAFQDEQNQRKMTVRIEVDLLQDSIREFEAELRKTGQFVGRQQSLIETYESDKDRFAKLDEELRIHELVASAFSKRGVPNRVIHSQLPIINSQINKLLHGIVNFTIELESDVETNALDVFINYGEKQRIIELASGMEKVIASLVLRAALTIITTLPKSDIFIIDEGFTDLDETGVEICNRLVKSFKNYFRNIIIITHLDGIKEMADNLIEIARVDGDSRVLNG
jgi:DNA repair exonuclease SbcCD ATPase subunit